MYLELNQFDGFHPGVGYVYAATSSSCMSGV